MIGLSFKLSGDMEEGLDKFDKKIRESVIFSGAAAMARVMYDEVKLNTSGARQGGGTNDPPGVVTGTLHNAIYRVYSRDRSNPLKKVYHVSVNKAKARHWWLVEYGNSRHPAHPYLRPAFDHIKEAIAAGNARMAQRLRGGA